ncbi:hypothetical protein AF331_12035 [Rossellomorea marisflavi]|uniref:Uncharacterized protein n=1 Tax=Rossellomorea marisflavi TaxID=189381 RepID=A0A0M0G5D4_9BACI|nr:hypothetical protein AF331_12035 [Rossellomorea marisflavi]
MCSCSIIVSKTPSKAFANNAFLESYFEMKVGPPFRHTLELKGHRLIHRHLGKKTSINLYQVDAVGIRNFRTKIKLINGKAITLPIEFHHQSQIYAILKHHRPDEFCSALSTRTK